LLTVACDGRSNGDLYLKRALDVIEENAVTSATVDWDTVRRDAVVQAGEAPTTSRAHAAIRYVLTELADKHSHLLTPDELAANEPAASDTSTSTDDEVPTPRSVALEDRISYLWLPSFAGTSQERLTAFADQVQEQIAAADSTSVCGWIIDLRDNPGGNVWPMLAGVGPLVGEGIVGSYVYPDDTTVRIWYRNGAAGIVRRGTLGLRSSVTQASISGQLYGLEHPDPGVAVVAGPRTGSAGELVAIPFIGRPNTRIFGTATAGLTTNNDSFPLDDGAILVLATSIMADRSGRRYGGSIEPDSVVESDSPELPLTEQAVIAAASRWLREQAPCRQ
jgi:C-terminal processing protease CtpA/Prc